MGRQFNYINSYIVRNYHGMIKVIFIKVWAEFLQIYYRAKRLLYIYSQYIFYLSLRVI